MSSGFQPDDGVPINTTAVAIDHDKNSQHAVRWAISHLVISNPLIIIIHVRHHNNQSTSNAAGDSAAQHLFVPYRAYCARKSVQLKEIVIDHDDVSKALADYIQRNCITNIVVGASARSALTRRFKGSDVPSNVLKSAPEFCSVFVISKGKVVMSKAAARQANNTAAPPRQPSPLGLPPNGDQHHQDHAARGHHRRGGIKHGAEKSMSEQTRNATKTSPSEIQRLSTNSSLDNLEIRRSRSSFSHNSLSDEDVSIHLRQFGSVDVSRQSLDFGMTQTSMDSSSTVAVQDLEAEMRRLKLELKQTMDMYSTACKEAIAAKNKAKELNQWRLEETRKFEEVRSAEEAALAIAEMEKAKCKAAIEAAEAARRLADKEAQRRKHAEMKARQEAEAKNRALIALSKNDVRYRKYSIDEIEEATNKFSEPFKIGEGGYGPVYKGRLDHTPVAIKVLRPDAAQGRKQFQQEVEVLCCMRHPNMVLLLGACPEYGCLVYEYMSNGSLEDRIFRRGNTPPIPWRVRFRIAAEIGTALLFLHQTKPEPLVHRDLKPANILLDGNYVSKISDVGLARLVPPSVADQVTQYHMTSAAGTFCYIDPEYQQTGKLTTKSDTYSLGIMLLQIITARPPMAILHHVQRAIEKDKFAEMLDPTVTDWPMEETLAFAKLAIKCAQMRKKERPELGTVVVPELNGLRDFGRKSEPNEIIFPHNSDSSRSSVSSSHPMFMSANQEST